MFLASNIFSLFMDPIVGFMAQVLTWIHMVVPSYGWSLVLLAVVVRVALFPLTQAQFKSMAEMQKVQPLVKALQAKYKGDQQKLNTEMMALYKEHGVNPLASCFPLLLQMPVLFSLFYAIQSQANKFQHESFLWIGSSLHEKFPNIIGGSIHDSDVILFALYVVSMYFSVRFGSPPSTDPQVAQTNKIMSILSPAMLAFIGFKAHWPAALIIYWITFNILSLTQQMIMYRAYGIIGGPKPPMEPPASPPAIKNGKPSSNGKNGSALAKSAKNKR